MITADRKSISVARSHPNFQVGANGFETGRHCRRAAMNRVEAIRVHIVRKTAGTADSGDDDKIFLLDPEFRENCLYRGENRIVSAAGAPAHFLVGLTILLCQRRWKRRGTHGRFS